MFFRTASSAQAAATRALVETDLAAGVLSSVPFDWAAVFKTAVALSEQHTGTLGCRSLDTQAEIDHYWEKLTECGDEKAQRCGWLKD